MVIVVALRNAQIVEVIDDLKTRFKKFADLTERIEGCGKLGLSESSHFKDHMTLTGNISVGLLLSGPR